MPEQKEILVCTATPQEEKACRLGIQASGFEDAFRVLRTGIGLNLARSALTEFLSRGNKPSLIVSTGFAGAITPKIPDLYSWITAQKVFSEEKEIQGINIQQHIPDTTMCALISLPHVFRQGKSVPDVLGSLKQPLAVDMESATLALVSGQYRIPFMVLRMITDTPQEPLPELLCTLSDILLTPNSRGKLQSGILSFNEVRKDIPGLVRIVRKIGIWSRLLKEGWIKYAPEIQKAQP